MEKQHSKPKADTIRRVAMIMRIPAVVVMVLLMLGGRAYAQTTIDWDFVGSGTRIQTHQGMEIVSILGAPLVGSASAGCVVLTTGFGTYILSRGAVKDILDPMPGVPAEYSLSQSYPNPFNSSTTILYGLPATSMVRLTVYDVLGRNIATLYDGEQAAGFQRLTWIAPVSTGVYFYRIDATSVQNPERRHVRVLKMLVLK